VKLLQGGSFFVIRTLNNKVDAGVVTPEGVRGDASEQSRISPLGSLDTQIGFHLFVAILLSDRVPKHSIGIHFLQMQTFMLKLHNMLF